MENPDITAALVRLLEAKLQDKKAEMEGLSQPILERTPEYNHRKFQVEVEHWQLHGLLTDIRSLVTSLSPPEPTAAPETGGFAAQNDPPTRAPRKTKKPTE